MFEAVIVSKLDFLNVFSRCVMLLRLTIIVFKIALCILYFWFMLPARDERHDRLAKS